MSKNLTLGTECEFLYLQDGRQIRRLTDPIIAECDLIGVDGHRETLELRTLPTQSAVSQYYKVSSAIAKYIAVLQCAGLYRRRSGASSVESSGVVTEEHPIHIRGGAFYNTALGIHIHFGNFKLMELVIPMLEILHEVLIEKFLSKVGPIQELYNRRAAQYGQAGLNSFRLKGPNWWEWREPFSCLAPPHLAILLGGSELIARAVLAVQNSTKLGKLLQVLSPGSCSLEEALGIVAAEAPAELIEWNVDELLQLSKLTCALGPINWSRNLAPLWRV